MNVTVEIVLCLIDVKIEKSPSHLSSGMVLHVSLMALETVKSFVNVSVEIVISPVKLFVNVSVEIVMVKALLNERFEIVHMVCVAFD